MGDQLPAYASQRIADFLSKYNTQMGRLIFAIDATQSRQPAWDSACKLQGQMFAEAAKLGTLQVQLVYYRGLSECRASRWTADARALARTMSGIQCRAGETQIGKVLAHIRRESTAQKVNAAIFVGDALEEKQGELYDAAAGLGVPLFMFQESNDPVVEQTFKEMAQRTSGAYCRFEAGAESRLAELLRAVAVFAVGGLTALADQRSDGARLLLTQMKPGGGK
jgi:hypothetical protein